MSRSDDAPHTLRPISTVCLGMWGADGKPMPTVTSAVCNVCGDWADRVWSSGQTVTKNDDLLDVRVSRAHRVVVYACPDHSPVVEASLVNEYGWASNDVDADELAREVAWSQGRRQNSG